MQWTRMAFAPKAGQAVCGRRAAGWALAHAERTPRERGPGGGDVASGFLSPPQGFLWAPVGHHGNLEFAQSMGPEFTQGVEEDITERITDNVQRDLYKSVGFIHLPSTSCRMSAPTTDNHSHDEDVATRLMLAAYASSGLKGENLKGGMGLSHSLGYTLGIRLKAYKSPETAKQISRLLLLAGGRLTGDNLRDALEVGDRVIALEDSPELDLQIATLIVAVR
ncbi:MAG: hypothetical protein Q9185_005504 [Variospora sp. 1 TL-2023]